MQSQKIVDLRKRKSAMRPLALRDTPQRRISLHERRRRRQGIIAGCALLALALALYGVSYASYLPRFAIQGIEVTGTTSLSPALVRIFAESIIFNGSRPFLSRSLSFLYPRREMEESILTYFPRIKSVRVSRSSLLARTIEIVVEEREAHARWCGEECFTMDKDGIVFARVATSSRLETQYIFRGGLGTTSPIGSTYLPGNLSRFFALLERLGQAGFGAEEITVEDGDFFITLSRGFTVRATFGADIGELVRNLELVLSSEALRGKEGEIEYIDLRFGNRVYYK